MCLCVCCVSVSVTMHDVYIIQSLLNKITLYSYSVALYLGANMIVATNTLTGPPPAHMIPTLIQAYGHLYKPANKLDLFQFLINNHPSLAKSPVPSVTSLSFCCSYTCVTGCLLPSHVYPCIVFCCLIGRTFLFIKTDKIAAMPIFLLLLLCSILGGLLTLNKSE